MESYKPNRKHLTVVPLEMRIVLDKCALIETRCSEIYRHFAHTHSEFPELAALWFRTAEEEEHHATQFKMLSKLKGDSIVGVKVAMGEAVAVLERLDALLAKLKRSSVTPEQALKIAIKLETHLGQFHSNSVAICSQPDLQNLLDAMMENDRGHVDALEMALAQFSPGKEAFSLVLKKLESFFQEIQGCKLTPAQILKVAIKLETHLNLHHLDSASASDPEIRQLLKSMIQKNKGQVALIEETLERLVAEGEGRLSREHQLARAEHRPGYLPDL